MYEEKIIEILEEIKPGVDFKNETKLVDDGIITSIDVVSISSELNDEFDIEITVVDIVPENFNSVKAMSKMVERLEEE